jgi:spoIIIJ-associated protein
MESYEFEARTVEDAIAKACEALNVKREDLNIEVISEGSSGIFGLMGLKKAKIRVSLKKGKEEAIKLAQEMLEKLLSYFPMPTKIETEIMETEVRFNIIGDGSGVLIGKQGQTLMELEHLFQKMVQKQWKGLLPVKITLDAEGYRQRRAESLAELAKKLAAKVKKTGKILSTLPLPAKERKIIHLTLQKDKQVKTQSVGEGELKRVNIIPLKRRGPRKANFHS